MRKLHNTVSNFGNVIVRQGNLLVVRFESLRSLCASSYSLSNMALSSYASSLASWLGDAAGQGPAPQRKRSIVDRTRTVTASCFATATDALVKQYQRRHLIMCHRAAA